MVGVFFLSLPYFLSKNFCKKRVLYINGYRAE